MNFKDLEPYCFQFMNVWKNDQYGRYHSYDDCRKVFLDNYNEKTRDENKVALYLFYYLASWGMLRGSGWLMQKDYHIFIPIVKLLYQADRALLNYDPAEGKLTRDEYVNKVYELGINIDKEFKKLRYYKYDKKEKRDQEKKVSTTDRLTLISKILMGTLGCTPAVDNFDKETLRALFPGGPKTYGFTTKTFERLWALANDNNEILKSAQVRIASNEYGIEYPIFKILDMFLWQYGKINGTADDEI